MISVPEKDGCVLEHADSSCVVIYRKSIEGKKALKLSAYMERVEKDKIRSDEKLHSSTDDLGGSGGGEKTKEKEMPRKGSKINIANKQQQPQQPQQPQQQKQQPQQQPDNKQEFGEDSSDSSTGESSFATSSEDSDDTWSEESFSNSETESVTEDDETDFNARASFFTKTDMFGDVLVTKRYIFMSRERERERESERERETERER